MKELAEKYHKGQFRKGKEKLPYIVHPEKVVKLLLEWGAAPESPLIAAAWGHDLLEDTKVKEEEILAVGGERVLSLIQLLTCPEGMEKDLYLRSVAEKGDVEALLIKSADRLSNTKDFVQLNGALYALQYLHSADRLLPALERFASEPMVKQALEEWKALEETLERESERDCIRGCLLGGGAGDALGSPVEFMTREEILKKYGREGVKDYVEFPDGIGAITDDTQMTLFTAEGILRAVTRLKTKGISCGEGVVRFAYLRWLKTQGITPNCSWEDQESGWLIKEKALYARRAPGNTCISALRENAYTCTNVADNDSKGCGSVMRMAPAGLLFGPEEAYEMGCKFSLITHGHPTGVIAGGAFAMLIAYLKKGYSLKRSLTLVERCLEEIPEAEETLAAMRKAETAQDIRELGEGWVAEEALSISIYAALRHEWDFAGGVLEAINITGDSDSVGAITGNILGALNGEKGIPSQWLKNLREYHIISRIADDVHKKYEEGEDLNVTRSWWEKYPGF